jgi:hypothetical protein
MEKEFVPYQQAVSLKELGFDEHCHGYYDVDKGYSIGYAFCYSDRKSQPEIGCLAPTYSQAFRWFREKYGLHSEILLDQTTQPKYCFEIHKYEDFGNYEEIRIGEWFLYRTYEEAELACLVGLIEIIKEITH